MKKRIVWVVVMLVFVEVLAYALINGWYVDPFIAFNYWLLASAWFFLAPFIFTDML